MLKYNRLAIAALIALGLSAATAHAGKIEKVDMVKEAIDMTPVEVRANSNGYAAIRTKSHKYSVRVYAKAKGANHVFSANVASHKNTSLRLGRGGPTFFVQQAPGGSDGWGVYKNSLVFNAETAHSKWTAHPMTVCDQNLKKQVANGMTRRDVLRREWRLQTQAVLYFTVAADSKSRIKKRKTGGGSTEFGSKAIYYPVKVLCEEAL